MDRKFQKMLLGKLPDFGYGTDLVVSEDKDLWDWSLIDKLK